MPWKRLSHLLTAFYMPRTKQLIFSWTNSMKKTVKLLKSSILDKEPVHRVVSRLLEAESLCEETTVCPSSSLSSLSGLRFSDVFIVPKYQFDPIRKLFYEAI